MDDTDAGERSVPSYRAGAAVLDLVTSKLRVPSARSGTVRRSSLVERLSLADSRPIVSVVAPAGYGKTTLLAQWAERNGQAFAWVSVDDRDNDPKVLLTYLAQALNGIEPVGGPVFDALASPTSSVSGSVVPRLASAFAAMTTPVALVLDDVHVLHNRECRSALSVLADHVPSGSRLVLASRNEPPLRIARLRAEGRILEIGPADLSLSREQAALLLHNAGLALGGEEVAELHRRTEGWPTGLYLAALSLLEGGSVGRAAASFGGDDRFVSEYVESELLARISQRQRAFLTRTAALERMSGAMCEAVLDLPGSDATLAELARSNLLLVPLDRRGQWYRYHHLFRDMLLAGLERQEPGVATQIRRRAAGWCLRNDLPEEALEYSMAAGDVDTAAALVEKLAVPARRQGRVATLQRWFQWLDDRGGIETHPMIMALAVLIYAWMGRPAETDRWADAVDRWQDGAVAQPDDPAVKAWAALGRAFVCRHGISRMLADADEAARLFPDVGVATAAPALLQGIARILSGDLDGGDAALADAVSLGEGIGTHDIAAEALGERSLAARAHGEWDRAEDLARQARTMLRRSGAEESYAGPLVCAVQAHAAIRRGDVAAARQHLVSAQRARPLLTYAIPYVAGQALIELIRVHLALADTAGARTLMEEVDDLLNRRPGLGTLVGEAHALRSRIPAEGGRGPSGVSSLTVAELRILPMLATHLPVPEIAAELFLSPHTIKSQMKSIYRKLGVATRSQAVARSRELALLEG
jgi:LuxR family transcriptional regulator, maltose regulon positive regulatory protein